MISLISQGYKKSIFNAYQHLKLVDNWFVDLLALSLIIFFSAIIYLYNAIRFSLPLGFAGLYTLMAQVLAKNNYLLPATVPFYGPGGIPLAYPPLALYLMAFATQSFHLAAFEYLRFAPVIFSILSLIPLTLFFRIFLRSRVQSVIAIVIIILSPEIYLLQVTSGGVVRAVGFLLANSSLLFAYLALQKMKWKYAAIAAFLLGLTVLTHLSYALFAFLSIGVLFLVEFRTFQYLKCTIAIFCGGFFVALPWLLTIISYYGFHVVTSAFNSHGNAEMFWTTYSAVKIPRFLVYIALTFSSAPVLGGLAISGFILTILQKKWFPFIWFVTVMISITECGRYLMVIASVLASIFIYEIASVILAFMRDWFYGKVIIILALTCILLFGFAIQAKTILGYSPAISDATFELGEWFQSRTKSDARYLFLMPAEENAEWLPYLLKRTPVVGHWGAEWLGTYNLQRNILAEFNRCYQEQSFDCITSVMDSNRIMPEYLIIPEQFTRSMIVQSLQDSPGWDLAYTNSDYQVWQR